ncbi:MAG: glycosyltransferase [Rhizomicrobium sp.]
MNLVFVTPGLRGGGAEQALADIANGFARQGRAVQIISLAHEADISYLDGRVPVRFLQDAEESAERGGTVFDKLRRRIRVALRLRRALIQTGSGVRVIGFLEPIALYLWLVRLMGGPRYLVSLHTQESLFFRQLFQNRLRLWLEEMLLGAACRASEHVTLPSEGCCRDLIQHFNVPAEKVRTLQNPVDLEKVRRLACVEPEWAGVMHGKAIFVQVARLVAPKNHRLLVEACKRLRAKHEDFIVICCGEGPLRPAIESWIAEAGLENHIRLLGHISNPYALMARARGVLLTSDYESFGLVLVEAMVCGTPPISTDCPSGPADVLSEGAGLLVPLDAPDAFSDAMLRLIKDDALHAALQKSGLMKAKTYSADNAVRLWSSLLTETQG